MVVGIVSFYVLTMKKLKRFLRLVLLMLMIGMASILPVPILLYGKDNLPKNLTEQVETTEDEDDEEEMNAYF